MTLNYTCFTEEEFEKFKKKKDILLFKNNLNNIKNFRSDKAYKELFIAILDFCNGNTESPIFTNEQAEATFEIIKSSIIENTIAYCSKCSTNKENAKKGVEKKKDIRQEISQLANSLSINNKEDELSKQLKNKNRNSFMKEE